MKRFSRKVSGLVSLLALVGLALGWTGCGTVEGDAKNVSSRPWNTPKYWEGGLPTAINEGR